MMFEGTARGSVKCSQNEAAAWQLRIGSVSSGMESLKLVEEMCKKLDLTNITTSMGMCSILQKFTLTYQYCNQPI